MHPFFYRRPPVVPGPAWSERIVAALADFSDTLAHLRAQVRWAAIPTRCTLEAQRTYERNLVIRVARGHLAIRAPLKPRPDEVMLEGQVTAEGDMAHQVEAWTLVALVRVLDHVTSKTSLPRRS